MKKTNGIEQEINGMKIYILEWEADIITQKEFWKLGTGLGLGYWQSFNVQLTEPNVWDKLSGGQPIKCFNLTGFHLTGDAKLQKTENGWRVQEFNN